MKKFLIVLVLLSGGFISFCQNNPGKVIVRGIALDTTNGRNLVSIIVNDTLRRFSRLHSKDYEHYHKLYSDTNYNRLTGKDGRFEIPAFPTDSLFFRSYRHIGQAWLVADLLKQKSIDIRLLPEVCVEYTDCNDTLPEYFVFVGEKIEVTRAPGIYYCNRIPFDSEFRAHYKVVENVYNKLPGKEVSFTVFDHYGLPPFSNYKRVLLFLGEYCGKLYHEKYQFYPLYETEEGRWASPYPADDYFRLKDKTVIKPEIISFKTPVEIPIRGNDSAWVSKNFPAPYYKIVDGKAIALYGNYIPELIEIKKQTILKARNIKLE